MTDIRLQFEQLMDHLQVPAFILDVETDGSFIFRGVNALLASAIGMSNNQLKAQNVYDVLPKRFADTVTANYAKCVELRAAHKYEEVLGFETGEIWWLTTLSPLFDHEDRVIGIVGLAEDITEYKHRQFEALESLVEMQKLSEKVSAFTGLAAHDLRGPLRQIRLVTEIAEDGFIDQGDGKKELLTMIKDVAGRALEKVDEVLLHAQSFIDETDNTGEVDFAHLCADLIALLDPMSHFEVSYPTLILKTEPVALQLVLRNLMDNAFKHATFRVEIELEQSKESGERLEIRVSDDGPGFADPQAALEQIKDHASNNKRGFGLSTVARLVASRGGHLWIGEPKFTPGATICWTANAWILSGPDAT
ncbi:PAS domain-containing sensor histidine kinase [Hoeflea sp.]|uniref:PAS domain-containing sensor histidine kinase n=1 Tax=Hoeflea sp. TaxID=1940281 RepID=UPI003A8DE4E2